MGTVTLEEAQPRLPELIAVLSPGEELHITRGTRTFAWLTVVPPKLDESREPGFGAGNLIVLSEDDDHLEDFREYMPSEGGCGATQ